MDCMTNKLSLLNERIPHRWPLSSLFFSHFHFGSSSFFQGKACVRQCLGVLVVKTSRLPPGARRDPELLGYAILRAVCAHCDARIANLAGSHARGPGNALIEEKLQTSFTSCHQADEALAATTGPGHAQLHVTNSSASRSSRW